MLFRLDHYLSRVMDNDLGLTFIQFHQPGDADALASELFFRRFIKLGPIASEYYHREDLTGIGSIQIKKGWLSFASGGIGRTGHSSADRCFLAYELAGSIRAYHILGVEET